MPSDRQYCFNGWSQDNRDVLRDFVEACAGTKPGYTTQHPSCLGDVVAVNLCWKLQDTLDVGRYQAVCSHKRKHFHFMTERLSLAERQDIVRLRSILQQRAKPRRVKQPAAHSSSTSSVTQGSNGTTGPSHRESSSQASSSSALLLPRSSSPVSSSDSDSEIEVISWGCPPTILKDAIRLIIFLEYSASPSIIELPWPEAAEYVVIIDHLATINAVMDARAMSIVRQYNGVLTNYAARRLLEGTAGPSLFKDDEDWTSAIQLRDVMILERPSTGCVIFATPSVLAHRLAEQQRSHNEAGSASLSPVSTFSRQETLGKGKRKASSTPVGEPKSKCKTR